MNQDLDPRPIPELLAALSADLRSLVTETAGLARAEVQKTASALATSVAGMVAGAIVLLFGVAVLAAALVLIAVALGLAAWAAALLVGAVFAAGGAITIWSFLGRLKTVSFNMPETRRSLTETLTWLKAQALP
jgi:membrane protein